MKHSFRRLAAAGTHRLLTRRVVRPPAAEVARNRASRSARLRAVCRARGAGAREVDQVIRNRYTWRRGLEPNAPLPWRPHLGWGTESQSRATWRPRPWPAAHSCLSVATYVPCRWRASSCTGRRSTTVRSSTVTTRRTVMRFAGMSAWGLFVVLLSLIATSPRLWVRHSGYRQAQLTETVEQLVAVREHLKVEKGRLEDLQRVAVLAADLGLEPYGGHEVHMDGPASAGRRSGTDRGGVVRARGLDRISRNRGLPRSGGCGAARLVIE